QRQPGFGGMVGVVEANGDEIADRPDTWPDAGALAGDRQLVDLGLGDLGEALRAEHVAGDVRHDARQVADAALGINDAWLLTASRAETHEFHVSPKRCSS